MLRLILNKSNYTKTACLQYAAELILPKIANLVAEMGVVSLKKVSGFSKRHSSVAQQARNETYPVSVFAVRGGQSREQEAHGRPSRAEGGSSDPGRLKESRLGTEASLQSSR